MSQPTQTDSSGENRELEGYGRNIKTQLFVVGILGILMTTISIICEVIATEQGSSIGHFHSPYMWAGVPVS